MISAGLKLDALKSLEEASAGRLGQLGTQELTPAEGDEVVGQIVVDKALAAKLLKSAPKRGAEAYFESVGSEGKPIRGNTERAIALAAAAKAGNVDALKDALIESAGS